LRGCGKSELTGLLVKAIPVADGKNNYYIGLLIKKNTPAGLLQNPAGIF